MKKNMYIVSTAIVALTSRFVCYLLAQVGSIIEDHNPGLQNDVRRFKLTSNGATNMWNAQLFVKWDSVYYVNLCQTGSYLNEKELVFYPLFPYVLRILSSTISLTDDINTNIIAVAAVINNVLSIVAIYLLGQIALKLTNNNETIYQTAMYSFCFSPVSVFYSVALYTEPLYTVLTFYGFYLLHSTDNRIVLSTTLKACLAFYLASFTKSTGLFNVVYIVVFKGMLLCQIILNQELLSISERTGKITEAIAEITALCIASLYPHIYWNYYSSHVLSVLSFVNNDQVEISESFHFPFKTVYSYLQHKYWNVSFLSQFNWRQLPNFVLATPIFILSVHTIVYYSNIIFVTQFKKFGAAMEKSSSVRYCTCGLLASIVHLSILLIVCFCFAHIQVTTRVIFSSCPIIYVSCGRIFAGTASTSRSLLIIFFIVYFIVGIILHTNFYPWT